MTQIEVDNDTPYRRRIFLRPRQSPVKEPIPLMLSAWKHFDLGAGERVGAASGVLRIGIRIAHGSSLDHRTVVADVNYGEVWEVQLIDGIPTLSRRHQAGQPASIQVFNGLAEPDAVTIGVRFYCDYAPWLDYELPPDQSVVFSPGQQLFAYASVPVADDSAPLVIEPVVGSFLLDAPGVVVKVSPSADGTTIQWTSSGIPQ